MVALAHLIKGRTKMNFKKAIALLAFCCFLSLQAFADTNESSKKVVYSGQNSEEIALETTRSVTKYRSEEVDSTCTRQIPYTVNECGYETRYRNECHWRAGENVCRTENNRICRNETRYRRQCTTTGTRRECRNEPPRQRCRTRNGERRCVDVPGRRVCRDVPGRQTCRQVPYTDRVCRNEPRRRCEWIPGRNVCRNVSYQEYVCKDVTRYRDEQYACKKVIQVPYQVQQAVKADVSVNFVDHFNVNKLKMKFNLEKNGNVQVNFKEDVQALPYLIKVVKRNDRDEHDDGINANAHFTIEFMGKDQRNLPVLKGISNLSIRRDGGVYFKAGKASFAALTDVYIKVRRWGKDRLVRTISLADVEVREDHGDMATYRINVKALGLSPKKGKNYKVTVRLTQKRDADIINAPASLPTPEISDKMKAK